jgi:hypothetical protein
MQPHKRVGERQAKSCTFGPARQPAIKLLEGLQSGWDARSGSMPMPVSLITIFIPASAHPGPRKLGAE